ncbi:MAG: 16S rRNA processing protein RimM [Ignavibacteriales bacterium]|nr:16S rRNA processing protein RimM [Ignavibacteriales bacterium]
MNDTQAMQPDEVFVVAQIVGYFGVKGYLKVFPLTHSPERLSKLAVVKIGLTVDTAREQEIENIEFQHRTIIIKLKGVDDRTSAEQFIHNYIFILKDELVKPPKGSWFIHDIIGCEIFLEDGTPVGTVKDVMKISSNDIWEIVNEKQELLFPVVKEFIKQVDVRKRRIVIAPPDGLFDL